MTYIHKNIKGVEGLSQLLLAKSSGINKELEKVNYLYITNVSETRSFNVSVFLYSIEKTYYLFSNITLAAGTTLKLDGEDMSYDNTLYDLYIKLINRRDNVDIKIKKEL